MSATKYGYARSSNHPNEVRQIIALTEAGISEEMIFVDIQSGKDFEHPEYLKLISILKPDDTAFIKSIDRLGRNYTEILQQWNHLTKELMVDIVILDMPLLDTRVGKDLIGTFISDLVLQILSFVAENERANIRQRQKEGIAAAHKRGVRFGRPPVELPDNFEENLNLCMSGEISVREAARRCGMSKSTFFNRIRKTGDDPVMMASYMQ